VVAVVVLLVVVLHQQALVARVAVEQVAHIALV
jgi:hypothetical protein